MGDLKVVTRQFILAASVVISIAVIGLAFRGDAEAGTGAVGDAPLPSSPSPVRATEATTLTHQVYLPLACKNFPPVIHVPEGEYLFVEYWTHSVLGVDCAGLCIDFPTYDFDPQSGKLTVYTAYYPEPAPMLGDDDIGYIGRGISLGGVGCGASSNLTRIQQCPLSEDGMKLRDVDETGTIDLKHKGEVVVLEADEVWVSDEETEIWEWLGAECVVTSTHYITNYAFQDRNKIIFLPDRSSLQ